MKIPIFVNGEPYPRHSFQVVEKGYSQIIFTSEDSIRNLFTISPKLSFNHPHHIRVTNSNCNPSHAFAMATVLNEGPLEAPDKEATVQRNPSLSSSV
jgi:hypothetical protein